MVRRDRESPDGTGVDRHRRAAVKLAGAGTLWAATAGVTAAAEGLHLSLSHATTKGPRAFSDGQYASLLSLEGGHLKLNDTRWLRVVDDRGRSVTVKPESDAGVRLDGEFDLEIYDGDGSIVADPVIDAPDGDVPVEVSGDTSMFQSDPIFGSYTVEVIEDGTVATSTSDRIYGVGYPSSLDQDSTTGEIEVTFPLVEEVQPSWAVVFEIVNYDADYVVHEQVRTEFEMADDVLVTTFEADEVDPVPDGGFRDYDVLFYVDGDPDDGPPNLWAGGDLVIGEDAELTDAPTATPDVTETPTEIPDDETDTAAGTDRADDPGDGEGAPGFGVAGALAGLGSAAYVLQRRVGGKDGQGSTKQDQPETR